MEISVVFGNGNVILNDSIPIKIEMNTVFGATVLDDKHMNAFGKTHFTTSAYAEGKPHMLLETNVVFGKITITTKKW
jgi:hypothetical protein